MACSKLEDIGKTYRADNLPKNIYQETLPYSETHPNATQAPGGVDDVQNKKGKGTGIDFDTNNGGSTIDINGRPDLVSVTGRAALYTNTYNPNNIYSCEVSEDF